MPAQHFVRKELCPTKGFCLTYAEGSVWEDFVQGRIMPRTLEGLMPSSNATQAAQRTLQTQETQHTTLISSGVVG